jgi:D-3-phosphoglycerate dehydrogenase
VSFSEWSVGGVLGACFSFDPYAPRERPLDLGVELVDLETLLRESDFLTINASLNAET